MKQSLNIALVGYGRMGQMIAQIAQERGHRIALTIDKGQEDLFGSDAWAHIDVAIEFTTPSSAFDNCSRCLDLGIPVVSGTTGWSEGVEALRTRCDREVGATVFWSSNFSIGVYLFLELNRQMARLMNQAPEYSIAMSETHHIHKLDAPSGTAITLAETILDERPELSGWSLIGKQAPAIDQLPISSVREGEVAGIHSVSYTSGADRIVLTHEALGRQGFALGAVLAAEYAASHTGFLTMADMLRG